jgi:predicted nucleic acid-binding protein
MAYLLDTNVLLRVVNENDPARTVALNAIRTLRRQQEMLCYTPQVLAEFWNVCTRPPSARGGFGLSPDEADRRARVIERYLTVLPDSLATYQEWRRLIVTYAVAGVAVHDARLVASLKVYGITALVTFNVADFQRYRDIVVVAPQTLAARLQV